MAEEQQLQLGPVERLDGNGQPLSATPEEDKLYQESLEGRPMADVELPVAQSDEEAVDMPVNFEPEFSDEELAAPVDAFSTGMVETFDPLGVEQVAPALRPQLEMTADIINSLNVTSRPATMEEMRRAFNEDVFGTTLDEAIKNLLAAEGPARQQKAMEILNRTDLSVMERLDIVRSMADEARIPDMNIIERNHLLVEAKREWEGKYDDEAEAAYVDALESVASIPRLAAPTVAPEAEVDQQQLQTALEEYLNLLAEDAHNRAGVANFLPNLIPFYAAVPITRILSRLNKMTGEEVLPATAGALLNGTALRVMREKVETLSTEQKIEFLGEVLRVLKPNSGALHHENAHITLYTIQSLFYKDLTGEDFVKMASDEQNKSFIHALAEADRAARHAAAETDPAKKAAFKQAEQDWFAEAQNIKAGADGKLWTDSTAPTFTQWLDDMAILDFMGLPAVAMGTVKLGKKGAMGVFRRMSQAAPEAATGLAVEALTNPTVRKKLGKLLGEDVAEVMLPTAMKGAEEAGINGMVELAERAKRVQEEVLRTLREGTSLTAEARNAFRKELETTLGQTGGGSVLHLDKSAFQIADDGVDYTVRYGRTAAKPYATLAAARKALADLPLPDAKIVQLDEAGKFVPVPDGKTSGKGRFFLETTDSRRYESSPSVWESAVFDRAQVRDPWMLRSSVVPLAKAWNWLVPSGSMFGTKIMDEVASMAMRAPVIQKLQTGLLHTLLHLPKHDQALVSALMKQGEELGTVLTTNQIRTMFPKASDEVVTAYYESRTLADNMYELANMQQRTEWFRSGVKEIVSSTGHVGFGRVLNHANDAVGDIKPGYQTLHVFDPETGAFSVLSRGEIDALYAQGTRLARLEDLVQGPKFAEATHVLLGKSSKVKELPRHVLPKIPGYYPHIFQGNHVVYGVSQAGNKVALAVAKTVGDAKLEKARIERAMNRMKKAGTPPYHTIDYQFDRSLRDPLTSAKDAADPIFGATSKVYGTRSGRMLRNASKAHGDHMVDPIEALLRGMELVSHSVSKGNLVKHMEQRLTNTLRLMERESGSRIIKDPRKVVKTPDDINYVSSVDKDHRKALAYMQQIDMVRHIPDAVERHMAVALVTAAELFDVLASKLARIPLPGSKSVAADLDRLGGKLVESATKGVDPTRLITETAHRVYIAANPIQQFALQMSQALMLTGVSGRDIPMAMSRSIPVATLLSLRTHLNSVSASAGTLVGKGESIYQKTLKVQSKLTGLPVEELDRIVQVMERSGLIDSVAMHSQMRTATRAQAQTRMLASASTLNRGAPQRVTMEVLESIDEQTFGRLSQIGFEAGEQFNRIITFMTLYQRDKRKGIAKLTESSYITKLVGEVNELVGSMLRETSIGYQRGWLKAAFQFGAFQHKMAALMLSSKQFTPVQRTKMALAQFLLFGSRGAFHFDAAHRAFENWIVDYEAANPEEKSKMVELYWHPTTQSMLDGMVFDMGVNELVKVVNGDDAPGFAWNRRLAPGGGTEMLVDTILQLGHMNPEKLLGLGGKQGSKIASFAQHVYRVSLGQSQDFDDVPAPERMKMLAKEGMSLAFSGYDKYLAASAAQRMGGWVTDTGNIFQDSGTGMEHWLYTVLGVQTEDREAYYDATDKLYADVRNDPKRHKAALESIADDMFRRMLDESVKFSSEATSHDVYLQLEGKAVQQRALLLSFLEPHEQEVVSQRLHNKIGELVRNRNTPAQETFYANLTKHISESGIADEEALRLGVYMEHSPLFQAYPQLQSDFFQKVREISEYEDTP